MVIYTEIYNWAIFSPDSFCINFITGHGYFQLFKQILYTECQ